MIAASIFLGSFLFCLYVYAGYPALIALLARIRPRPVRRAAIQPKITVIIPAFNEEACIERKIRGTLANGYPEELLEIIVASDGSTDGTNDIVRRLQQPGLRLLALPRNGKVAALNAAVSSTLTDIVVFTDADVELDAGALTRLVSNFADPDVGGATGRKAYLRPCGNGGVERGEGLYTRFDEWQKRKESLIASTISAHGALHAIRKELYVPVRNATAADDMAISMRAVLQGKRLVYEPDAVARVERPLDARTEFARKIRIANQAMRAMFGLNSALWTSGFYSVQLISHKLLRYFVPLFLIVMLVTNAALAIDSTAWRALLVLQAGFYAAAVAGMALSRRAGWVRLLTVPYYFCAVNASALIALLALALGRSSATWSPGAGFRAGPEPARARGTESRPASRTPAAV